MTGFTNGPVSTLSSEGIQSEPLSAVDQRICYDPLMSDPFDVIPFEVRAVRIVSSHTHHSCQKDLKGEWKKLGSGSFGNVYKGTLSDHTVYTLS